MVHSRDIKIFQKILMVLYIFIDRSKKPALVERMRQDSVMSAGSDHSSPMNVLSGSAVLDDAVVNDSKSKGV